MRSRLVIIAPFVLVFLLLTGGVAVVRAQPLLPGDAGYALQQALANFAVSLIPNPVWQADRLMTLAEERLEDYMARDGTIYEMDALLELDAALHRVAVAVAELDGSPRERLEAALLALVERTIALLSDTTGDDPTLAMAKSAVLARLAAMLASDEGMAQAASASPLLPLAEDIPFPLGSLRNHPFPLDGAHAFVSCEGCHTSGSFDTPLNVSRCVDCHADPHEGQFVLTCETCHNTTDWLVVNMDHTGLTDCTRCHAEDAPPNHYPGQCSNCHNTTEWEEAVFNHTGFTNCISCHTADAPRNHYAGQCSNCHGTATWKGARFNHTGLTDCISCHATDAPPNHYAGQCSQCHSTDKWGGARFDHTGQTDCIACHVSKAPRNHYAGQCSQCHSTDKWGGARFDHTGQTDCIACHASKAPRNHYAGQCSQCHSTDKWGGARFDHTGQTDCIACHASKAPKNHYPGQCSDCHSTDKWGGAKPP